MSLQEIIYTDDQKEAISYDGNLLILACAGSGKTEVISSRIADKIEKKLATKDQIIAFTFTEKAASELKIRIRRKLEEKCPDDPAIGDMHVGTIHSFCLELLREIDHKYRKYEVMDEARQAALLMTNFQMWDDEGRTIGLSRIREKTRTGGFWDTINTFQNTLNIIFQKNISIDTIPDFNLVDCIKRYEDIAYGYPNYFFDYNSIIAKVIEELKADKSKLNEIRNRFKYLFVDEYQDVDGRQEELISLITNDGRGVEVTAVGDDDQAIYAWRGAQTENILNFCNKYHKANQITLDYNFRSNHVIVDIANKAAEKIPATERIKKDMQAMHWDEVQNSFKETMGIYGDVQLRDFSEEKDEALWIANRIKQLRGTPWQDRGVKRGLDYADMAILIRSVRNHGAQIARVLEKEGIPVIVKGTGGLFENKEIQLIQAAFCLLSRVDYTLRNEKGEYTRYKEADIRAFIRDYISDLKDAKKMPTANSERFLRWTAEKREELDRRNLEKGHKLRGRLPRRIYVQSVFQEMLGSLGIADKPEPWPESVLFNLGQVSKLIKEFEAVHQWLTPSSLGSLSLYLGGWAASQVDEGGNISQFTTNAVQILTVHAAKGLEWPVVFLPRISSMVFPSSRRTTGPSTFLPPSIFNSKDYAVGDTGERRLWYVAVTRSMNYLNVTCLDRTRKRPTEYYKEISHNYIQRDGEIEFGVEKIEPTPPIDTSYLPTTFSDLTCYERCAFEYQMRSLMQFSPGVKEQFGYGQQIHNILAELHTKIEKGEHVSSEDIETLVENRFHLRYTKDGEEYKPLTALKEAAARSLKKYMQSNLDHSGKTFVAEKSFEFIDKESSALISGSIDLLQKKIDWDAGKGVEPVGLVEFKSHQWKDKKAFEAARIAAEKQLRLYGIAVGEALGFKAESALAYFLNPKDPPEGMKSVVEVDVSEETLQEMQKEMCMTIKSIRTSIENHDFERSGVCNKRCPQCDYKRICPGFDEFRKVNTNAPIPPSFEEEEIQEALLVEESLNAGNTSK